MIEYLSNIVGFTSWEIKLAISIFDHDLYGKLLFKNVYPHYRSIDEAISKRDIIFNNINVYGKWKFIDKDLFNCLTLVYFVSDAIGGYGFVRAISGYIRKGALISGGNNVGKSFYEFIKDKIYCNKDNILGNNNVYKSNNIINFLKYNDILNENIILDWFYTGQLRITDLIEEKILTDQDVYFNEPIIDQGVFVKYIADHNEVCKFVYTKIPPIPKIWTKYHNKEFWGIVNGDIND